MNKFLEAEEAAVTEALRKMRSFLKVDLITSSPAVAEGENFMSDAVKVDVTAHDETTGETFETCMFLKRLPQSAERRHLFQCDSAFSNEAAFYTNVLPFLQRQANYPLPFARCLGATPEFILLTHLGREGFRMCKRRRGLDLQHCLLVIREMAKFHAVSLAAKHTNPEEFSRVRSTLKEWLIAKENPIINTSVDNSIQMSSRVVTNTYSSTVRKVKDILGKGLEALMPQISPSEPLSVITHGDLWSNNLLFRYPQSNPKTPSGVCFLDLQVSRYGSPALDILYFLFTSSGPGVLRHHFHHLVQVYHQTLTDNLEVLAPDSQDVSLEDINREIKNCSLYGLIVSLLVLPVVTTENNNFVYNDLTEELLQDPAFQEDLEKQLLGPAYKIKVNELYNFCDSEDLI